MVLTVLSPPSCKNLKGKSAAPSVLMDYRAIIPAPLIKGAVGSPMDYKINIKYDRVNKWNKIIFPLLGPGIPREHLWP